MPSARTLPLEQPAPDWPAVSSGPDPLPIPVLARAPGQGGQDPAPGQRVLQDRSAQLQASSLAQRVKGAVRPGYPVPFSPLGVFVPGSSENEAWTRGTERVLGAIGRAFANQSRASMAEPPVPDAIPGRETRGRTAQWKKPGGMAEADSDFDGKHPENVRSLPGGGRVGDWPDGRKIIVRPNSTDGRPTLEIQDGSSRIKVRYGS